MDWFCYNKIFLGLISFGGNTFNIIRLKLFHFSFHSFLYTIQYNSYISHYGYSYCSWANLKKLRSKKEFSQGVFAKKRYLCY